jgi:hypothetical protein
MGRTLASLVLAACVACSGEILVPKGKSTPNGGAGAGGSGGFGGGEVVLPIEVVRSAPQVRVLSAPEYKNTIRDLLGLEVTSALTQSDWTAGYDNGSGIHVDDNLLHAFTDEAESLAPRYLAGKARADFPCYDPANVTDACVQKLIEVLGRRAHRRPLTQGQKDELIGFFRTVSSAANDRVLGTELVVERLLTSAQFLYRTEVGTPTVMGGDVYALDAYEKASLLAYTLTGTMPDDALLAAAEAGRLDEAGMRVQIRRIWADPGSRARVGDFFRQWLKVTRLDEMARRPADFAKLPSPGTGASLKAEFDAYVAAVVFDGAGTVPALFSETFTIADSNTAPLYGLTAISPTRLALDPKERHGVLTLASTMAAIASATDPSQDRPIVRGLMIKEQLLCEEVGPPSGINTLAAMNTAMAVPNFDQLTTREQYEAMMQQGAECKSCHRQFMPLGFALGRYDALGRYRVEQRGRPVTAAVTDVPFAGTTRAFADGIDLAAGLAESRRTAECFGKNFVAFAAGETHTPHTETLTAAVLQRLGTGPLAISRFVEETLAHPNLYLRKGVPFVPPAPGGAGGGGGGMGGGTGGGGQQMARTVLLASGARLEPDGAVVSTDAKHRLTYQLDGNLVLYKVSGGAAWASGTGGTTPGNTSMQADGNLVVYDRDGMPRFNTGTHGNPGAQLFIDAAGKLFIVAPDGRQLWVGGTP